MSETASRSYRGNCHCGAFIYTLTHPTIDRLSACDCSFCSKTGALWQPILDEAASQLSVVKGSEDDLHTYKFASGQFSYKSCKICGSLLLMRKTDGPEDGLKLLLNTRTIQELDIWGLPTENYPGKTMGDPYQTPEYDGPEPSADITNAHVYHGSCHCGKVKLAFKSEPFTEETQVRECNCSICQRNGYLWMYPTKNQVVIETDPSDALTTYAHASGVFPKTFCRDCGCQIQNSARELTREELDAFGSDYEEFYRKYKALELLNVRLLNGVALGTLKREKFKGATIPPVYVNP